MGDGRERAGQLNYDGTVGELYRIFVPNLLLTLVTLGVYRFWATTRTRRYLWSHMRFMGDRFEYTGTGGEKFRGFLLAMLVLILIAGANQAIAFAARSTGKPALLVLQTPLALLYITLFGTAVYAAQRYRLSRTAWRGIRGGMEPGAFAFGLRALGYWLLTGLTLGLTWPIWRARLLERRLNASSFGSAGIAVRLRGSALYGVYALTVLCIGVVLAAVVAVAIQVDRAYGGPARGTGTFSLWHWLVVVVVALAVLGGLRGLFAWVDAALIRQVAATLRFADLRLSSTVSGGALFRLRLGNALIWLCTLGLGMPFVTQRNARFLVATIQVLGTLDAAALRQTTLVAPRRGEGLLEALDVGIAG